MGNHWLISLTGKSQYRQPVKDLSVDFVHFSHLKIPHHFPTFFFIQTFKALKFTDHRGRGGGGGGLFALCKNGLGGGFFYNTFNMWLLMVALFLKEQLPVQPYLGIKMGGSDSHFNISLTVKGKVTRQGPKTTTFEGTGELKWGIKSTRFADQPNAFPLDQTDSSSKSFWWWQHRVRDSNHLPHPLFWDFGPCDYLPGDSSALTPSLLQPVKFPAWKVHAQACKQHIFPSYHKYAVNTAFWQKSFHVLILKR